MTIRSISYEVHYKKLEDKIWYIFSNPDTASDGRRHRKALRKQGYLVRLVEVTTHTAVLV